jgi:hypothetical protein
VRKILTIIPYFGGISAAPRQTELNNVEKYFKLCYESVLPFSSNIVVSVANDADFETVKNFGYELDIYKFTNIDPIFNPANLNRAAQQIELDHDFVYFTESDQIVYYRDLNYLLDTIEENKNLYIVPQRLEQIPAGKIEDRIMRFGTKKDRFVEFNGVLRKDNNPYVIANDPVGDEVEYNNDDMFYQNFNESSAYGAAFLCHKELFQRVKFHDSFYQPTETSAGHDILNTAGAICLKSYNPWEFNTDHLSGWEFNTKTL